MRQSASDSQQNLAQKIEKWKAGLADLGRRNPLIKFRQDSPRILEIITEEPDVLFQNLTEDKKSLYFQILDGEHQNSHTLMRMMLLDNISLIIKFYLPNWQLF